LYKNNQTFYDRQLSTGTQNDDFSQRYTFHLPDYILSNNNNNNNNAKEGPRSRTSSRIPTPVRNKTGTSMGHYMRNPSPLTIGSRIPILVASRPQSRADMYHDPPLNDQQAVSQQLTSKSPKTDVDTSFSKYDKNNHDKSVDDNWEIQSNIIDISHFTYHSKAMVYTVSFYNLTIPQI
jgi:hypothetical protein